MKRLRIKELRFTARQWASVGSIWRESLDELEAAHQNLDLAEIGHKDQSLHVRITLLAAERNALLAAERHDCLEYGADNRCGRCSECHAAEPRGGC